MIPVLMYHRIGTPSKTNTSKGQYVPVRLFRRQMAYLYEHGYRTIKTDDFLHIKEDNNAENNKLICLTFDDAYKSMYDHAFPILQEYGFTAIVFAVSDYIGKQNRWDRDNYEPIMEHSQIKNLIAGGFEVGSHSLSHRPLIDLSDDQMHKEIVDSKQHLQCQFDCEVNSFCYPYGAFNKKIIDLVKQHYKIAFSTKKGFSDIKSFALPRIDINKDKIMPVFILKLWEAKWKT